MKTLHAERGTIPRAKPLALHLIAARAERRGSPAGRPLRLWPSTARWQLAPDPANDATTLERLAAELHALVTAGRIGKARAILSQLRPEQRAAPALSRWARALEPPKVRIGPPGSTPSMERDAAWLRAHGAQYAGEWVALRDGVLLGHHVNQAVLYRELESRGDLDEATFVCLRSG